jgi:hypothetical protein
MKKIISMIGIYVLCALASYGCNPKQEALSEKVVFGLYMTGNAGNVTRSTERVL